MNIKGNFLNKAPAPCFNYKFNFLISLVLLPKENLRCKLTILLTIYYRYSVNNFLILFPVQKWE